MYTSAQLSERIDPSHGCAMGGVLAFSCGIENALPIVHGPTGCAGGYRLIMLLCDREPLLPTTAVYQYELAMGTRKKLEAALYKAQRIYNPCVIFVVLTCATSMAGEAYSDIVARFEADTGTKVFVQDGSILAGEDIDGYVDSYRAFTEWMSISHEPQNGSIAVDGISPATFGAKKLFAQIKSLLQNDCGLTLAPSVSLCFSPQRDREAYRKAAVLYAGYLWNYTQQRVVAPIGASATLAFAEAACRLAGRPLPESVRQKAKEVQHRFDNEAPLLRKALAGRWVMIEADAFYAIPLARLLKDFLNVRIAVSTDTSGYEALQQLQLCDWLKADMGGYELNEERKRMQCVMAFGSSNVNAHSDDECHYIPFTAPCWDEVPEAATYLGFDGATMLLEMLRERWICRT